MKYGLIEIDGSEYDLSHLNPFTIPITPKAVGAPTYHVLVSFGHHTFTRGFVCGADNAAFLYQEGPDVRAFCPDRYLASKGLPALVKRETAGKAYFGRRKNYILVDQALGGPPYAVFFNLSRATGLKDVDAIMFVVSAYVKPGLPKKNKLPSISFATLVSKVVRGEPIKPPKK